MNTEELIVAPLSNDLLEQAVDLCGECVGENLYTKEMLEKAIQQQNHFFYLLLTPENKAVAYIYFTLMEIREAERLAKHSLDRLKENTQKSDPLIGNLQSIGVHSKYRQKQLSKRLVKIYLQWLLDKTPAEIAFGVFWKPNGMVPMEKTLKAFGFSHLADTKRVWYDKTELICPVCGGRCECDAAIYYKQLERNLM